ncbi:MAG: response regulator receiver protein [Ferruginibacter sp.]|nr:response regulator receiver protein [Ferruginibacter sp.]
MRCYTYFIKLHADKLIMKGKVLIYDDDADILEVCSAILRIQGHEVDVRDNCRTLLEDIETYKPEVIMMDNWLPDIGGVKAIQLIKEQEKFVTTPVIFFSANSHVEELAKEAGADFVLKKPFDMAALQKIVVQALQKSRA